MKAQLREQVINQRKLIDKATQELASNQIIQNLNPLISSAQNIAVYHAHAWELSLSKVIEYAISQNKNLFQPISYRNTRIMKFAPYNQQNPQIFYPDNYVPEDEIKWYNLDLIILPLVAVDKRGYRLGKGGGYYDETLANPPSNKTTILCGVGFDSQMIEQIPVDSWDLPLDYFASEKRLIKFK